MVDVLMQTFRALLSHTDREKSSGVPAESAASPGAGALLVSTSGAGGVIRSSLLLLAAVTAASRTGSAVVFFAQKQIDRLPVCLQRRFPSFGPDSLKKIRFFYPRTLEELLQQVSALHEPTNTSPTPPSLMIVDRLEGFLCPEAGGGFQPGERSHAAHVCALLCDTAAFFTQRLQLQERTPPLCHVILSYQSESDAGESSDPVLDVLDRYMPDRCTLDRVRSYEAAAAGLQELWNVYLSGTRREGVWEGQLTVSPDGSMEFKLA